MLPETYNLKKESVVKICKSCSYLTESFRKVLLQGDCEAAQNLYATGNINLRCPLPATSGTTKSEIMYVSCIFPYSSSILANNETLTQSVDCHQHRYPVHCAVHGGNLNIVRWLMDEHFCPITLVLKTSNGKGRKSRNADGGTSILTSKGRSVLNIAMHELKVDIVRYLVVDKGVSVYEVKDLQLSLRALEAVLLAFPQTRNDNTRLDHGEIAVPRWDNANFSDGDASYVCSSLGADQSILDQFSFCENEQEAKVDMVSASLSSVFCLSLCSYLRLLRASVSFATITASIASSRLVAIKFAVLSAVAISKSVQFVMSIALSSASSSPTSQGSRCSNVRRRICKLW
jgi:hypothetical protein